MPNESGNGHDLIPIFAAGGIDIRWIATAFALLGKMAITAVMSLMFVYAAELFPTFARYVISIHSIHIFITNLLLNCASCLVIPHVSSQQVLFSGVVVLLYVDAL